MILNSYTYIVCTASVPPFIDESAIDVNVTAVSSTSAYLRCPFDGFPFPDVTWYKDGFPVNEFSPEYR